MRITLAVAVACFAFGGLAVAGDATAAIRQPTDIPAEGLGPALTTLAKTFDFQVLYRTEVVGKLRTGGVSGAMTAEEALDHLLSGTGLTYKYLDDKTVTIVPVSTGDSEQTNTANVSVSPNDANTSKEAGKKTSQDFRVAQMDQGKSADPISVSQRNSSSEQNSMSPAIGLEEIVVTAQRREESLNKVPMSIAAFSQQDLDDRHLQSLTDLAAVVPGLVIPTPANGSQSLTNIVIRGIGSLNNGATTGLYIDETSLVVRQMTAVGYSGSPQPDIFDVDRIEVLRGPQGTLFGSGAMGGAIRYVTPPPSLDAPSGYTKDEISYTDHGAPSYAVGVAYGAPIVEGTVGFRISGWYQADGGFIDTEDPFTGEITKRSANYSEAYTFRPAVAVVPFDGLTITPAAFIQHQHSAEPNQVWFNALPQPNVGAFLSGFGAHEQQPVTDDLTVPSLAIKYEVHGWTFQSDTSYLDRSYNDRDDYSNILPVYILGLPAVDPHLANFYSYDENVPVTKAWQQEFRVSSPQDPASRWSWVAGAYYRHSVDTLTQYFAPDMTPIFEQGNPPQTSLQATGIPDFVVNGVAYSGYGWSTAVTEQKALFGEVVVTLLPRLKANVGLRVEDAAVKNQEQVFAGPIPGTAFTRDRFPDDIEHPVTPRYGLTYQYTDDDMVYTTVAKGYRIGGSNSLAVLDNPSCLQSAEQQYGATSIPTTFTSDHLWSYEVGAKDAFFNHRVAMQASVYWIDWSDMQSQRFLDCGQSYTANAGTAISQGFDFQMAAILTDGFKANLTAGYNRAYVQRSHLATTSIPGIGPPWTAAAELEYSTAIDHLWSDSRAYIRLDDRFVAYWGVPPPNPNAVGYDSVTGRVRSRAYETLNVRIGVLHHKIDLSAFVNNATNANPIINYSDVDFNNPQLVYGNAIRPLTAGLTAIWRY